jgi:hypothetical protein
MSVVAKNIRDKRSAPSTVSGINSAEHKSTVFSEVGRLKNDEAYGTL